MESYLFGADQTNLMRPCSLGFGMNSKGFARMCFQYHFSVIEFVMCLISHFYGNSENDIQTYNKMVRSEYICSDLELRCSDGYVEFLMIVRGIYNYEEFAIRFSL